MPKKLECSSTASGLSMRQVQHLRVSQWQRKKSFITLTPVWAERVSAGKDSGFSDDSIAGSFRKNLQNSPKCNLILSLTYIIGLTTHFRILFFPSTTRIRGLPYQMIDCFLLSCFTSVKALSGRGKLTYTFSVTPTYFLFLPPDPPTPACW